MDARRKDPNSSRAPPPRLAATPQIEISRMEACAPFGEHRQHGLARMSAKPTREHALQRLVERRAAADAAGSTHERAADHARDRNLECAICDRIRERADLDLAPEVDLRVAERASANTLTSTSRRTSIFGPPSAPPSQTGRLCASATGVPSTMLRRCAASLSAVPNESTPAGTGHRYRRSSDD
jgi:hypothetical protein